MSEIARFNAKMEDEENKFDKEITAVPFNSTTVSNYDTAHKLESFANIREVAQLKKHLGRIEEIYISLAKSWKDSEENHDHVIIYLEEQLKTAKTSLVDAQLTASEEVAAVKDQMKVLQEQLSKQHEEDILELSKVRKVKEETEQSLQEAKEQITELNANVALHKQRTEQTANELAKRTKELGAASQEINFLKIQLEAEKDILKTTAKNHDQVISYLKEQLRVAKESLADSQMTAPGEANAVAEQVPESNNDAMLYIADVIEEKAEEKVKEVQDQAAELKAQVAINQQKAEEEAAEINNQKKEMFVAGQEISTPSLKVESNKETVKSSLQGQGNQIGTLKQSPILTAQQTREQLKMRLQGLQEVNELDKRNKEFRSPSQETSTVKAQAESNNEAAKNTIKSQTEGQAADLKVSAAPDKQKAEQDISERDKLNKNLSVSSQKIDVFW